MDEQMLAAKAAIAAFFGTLGGVLGWKGVMLVLLWAVMILDYLSGTLAAKKNKEWSSTIAREGLAHKGGIIVVTVVALIADVLFCYAIPEIPLFGTFTNPGLFLPLVLAWYIITEIGSVLENAMKMGAPVPAWFRKAISAAGKAVDKAGNENTKAAEVDTK